MDLMILSLSIKVFDFEFSFSFCLSVIYFFITPVVNVVTIVLCVAYWHVD